jgi:hypothetical protein
MQVVCPAVGECLASSSLWKDAYETQKWKWKFEILLR